MTGSFFKKFSGFLLAFLLLSAGFPATPERVSIPPKAEAGFFNSDLEILDDVLLLVSKNYVYPPDYEKIFFNAIRRMSESVKSTQVSFEFTPPRNIEVTDGGRKTQYTLSPDMDHDYEVFKKAFYLLSDRAGGSPSKKELETAGINGIMDSLDPYSQFLDEQAFERSMRDTEGQYGGLGMVITMEDYKLVVVKIMKGSPAEQAGIKVKDVILNVNGKQIKGMQIDDLAAMLRGRPKSKVTLTVFHPDSGEHKIYTLTREIISVETVEYRKVGEETGYVRISSFSRQTNEQLEAAFDKAQAEGVKAFILDLRNNPGGLLEQSVKVASHFLARGRLVVYTQGRERIDRDEYRAVYKNSLEHMPVAILLNQHSASASEIVAGALRDSGRALIVGERSYGKGSVQTIFRVREKAGIRLTTSKYYTPAGTDISEHGIAPEISIEDDHPEAAENEAKSLNTIPDPDQIRKAGAPIRLKRSSVEKYLKSDGLEVTRDNDSEVLFSHLVLKRALGTENRTVALEKARELAANIRY